MSRPNPSPHPAGLDPDTLLKRCRIQRTRRSGPGGQHRNKVETAVVITDPETGISGAASERRSQADNLKVAVQRLRIALALGVRSSRGPVVEYRPTEHWPRHVRGRRIAIEENHTDFPAMLAEALDLLQETGAEPGSVARILGCTATQLVRFLAREPNALELVNQWRESLGKRRLHPRP